MTIKSIRTGWTGISALAGNSVIGDFEPIATVTVGSSGQAEIDFTSIPATFQHLQIRYIARGTRNAADVSFNFRLNGATSNYAWHRLIGTGTATEAAGSANQSAIDLNDIPAATATASSFGAGIIDILDYADTNKNTTTRALFGRDLNGSGMINFQSGLYNVTTAVTSIKFRNGDGNFAQHSHFALYGIR